MTKIIMLGTGSGDTMELYNTCFIIQNKECPFLIDAGGSIEIIKRLETAGFQLSDLKNIFISHSHTDHILGLMWLLKIMTKSYKNWSNKTKINIYCNDTVYEAIKAISPHILQPRILEFMSEMINFIILEDGDKHNINGVEYTFFDILAKGTKQFGFECFLDSKKFIFLGDESLNLSLKERVRDADYVTHEAFCLDSEESIYHAYEKHHSTVLSAAKMFSELGVKNLIIYHTKENLKEKRKKLYEEEAKKVFKGNIFVPNDLEEIIIK